MIEVLKELNDLFAKRKQESLLFPYTHYPSQTRDKIYNILKKYNNQWSGVFSELEEKICREYEATFDIKKDSFTCSASGNKIIFNDNVFSVKSCSVAENFIQKIRINKYVAEMSITTPKYKSVLAKYSRIKPLNIPTGELRKSQNFALSDDELNNNMLDWLNKYFYNERIEQSIYSAEIEEKRRKILKEANREKNNFFLCLPGNSQLFTMAEAENSDSYWLYDFPDNIVDPCKPIQSFMGDTTFFGNCSKTNKAIINQIIKERRVDINSLEESKDLIKRITYDYNMIENINRQIDSVNNKNRSVYFHSFEHIMLSLNLKNEFEKCLYKIYARLEAIYFDKLDKWLLSVNEEVYKFYKNFYTQKDMPMNIYNELLTLPDFYMKKINMLDMKQKEVLHMCANIFDNDDKNSRTYLRILNPDLSFNVKSLMHEIINTYGAESYSLLCKYGLRLKSVLKDDFSLSKFMQLFKLKQIESLDLILDKKSMENFKKQNLIINKEIPLIFNPFMLKIPKEDREKFVGNKIGNILIGLDDNILPNVIGEDSIISMKELIIDVIQEYGVEVLSSLKISLGRNEDNYRLKSIIRNQNLTELCSNLIEDSEGKEIPLLSFLLLLREEELFLKLAKFMKKKNLLNDYIEKNYPKNIDFYIHKDSKQCSHDFKGNETEVSFDLSIMDVALLGLNSEKVLDFIGHEMFYNKNSKIAVNMLYSCLLSQEEYPILKTDEQERDYNKLMQNFEYVHDKFQIVFDASFEFMLRGAYENKDIARRIFEIAPERMEELFVEYDLYQAIENKDIQKLIQLKEKGINCSYKITEFHELRENKYDKSLFRTPILKEDFFLDWVFFGKQVKQSYSRPQSKDINEIVSILNIYTDTENDKQNLLNAKGMYGNLLSYITLIYEEQKELNELITFLVSNGQHLNHESKWVFHYGELTERNGQIKDLAINAYYEACLEHLCLKIETDLLKSNNVKLKSGRMKRI